MDLSKFKKSSEDKDYVVLTHPKGHEIKVAKGPLSPKLREQLANLESNKSKDKKDDKDNKDKPLLKDNKHREKMSDGGKVSNNSSSKGPAVDPQKAKEVEAGATESGWQPQRWAKNVKEGLKFANGTPEGTVADQANQSKDPSHITINVGGQPAVPDTNAQAQIAQVGKDQVPTKAPDGFNGDPLNLGIPPQAPGQPQIDVNPAAPPQPIAVAPPVSPPAPQQSSPNIATNPNQSATSDVDPLIAAQDQAQQFSLQGALGQIEGKNAEANAVDVMGKQQAAVYDKASKSEAKITNDFQKHSNEINQQIQHIQHDIDNSHIKPEQYWGNLSTAAKINTTIGLILGGIGSGLTGGQNPALELLRQHVNNDIEAQKAELGKKHNLLTAYHQQFGNLKDATSMLQLTLGHQVANQINAAGARAQGPIEKARAQQASSQVLAALGPIQQKLAMSRTLASIGTQKPASGESPTSRIEKQLPILRAQNPEAAKDIEKHLVPGIGISPVEVPEAKRQKLIDQKTALDSSIKLREFANKHSGSLNPATIQEGKALAFLTLNQYRTGTGQGVYKEAQAEADKKLVAEDPTAFFGRFRTDPRYKVLEESLRHEYNNNLKGAGLPTSEEKSGEHGDRINSFKAFIAKNPNDPRSKKLQEAVNKYEGK